MEKSRGTQAAQLSRRKVGPWLRTALPWFSHAAPARKEEGRALAAHGPPLVLPCCASSQRGRSGLGCARPSPGSPMLRQLAKRKVGPWLRTALPWFSHAAPARKEEGRALAAHGPPHFSHAAPARKEEGRALAAHGPPHFSHAAPARKRGRSGLGCARPSPVSPMLRQLAKEEGRALAAHGPPPFLPCCASSHGSLPKKANFQRFSCNFSCPPRGNRVFFEKNNPFHNPISSFIKTIPTSVGTSSLCIILHNNTKEYCNMEHKFSKIRSSLIAHRSSLIAHRKN